MLVGTTKRGRPRKSLKDEVQRELNIKGIKKQENNDHRPSEMEKECTESKGPQ
jgi:hypothetical protein